MAVNAIVTVLAPALMDLPVLLANALFARALASRKILTIAIAANVFARKDTTVNSAKRRNARILVSSVLARMTVLVNAIMDTKELLATAWLHLMLAVLRLIPRAALALLVSANAWMDLLVKPANATLVRIPAKTTVLVLVMELVLALLVSMVPIAPVKLARTLA